MVKKKKFICSALALATCLPMALAGCSSGGGKDTGDGKLTVTYQDGETVLLEQSVSSNGKAYDWTPTKEGYVFDDWYTTTAMNVPYDFTGTVTADTVLYAKFEAVTPSPVKYAVTFYDADGTTALMEQQVAENGRASEWTPKKDGYNFVGWYSDSALKTRFDFGKGLTADAKAYAKFEEIGQFPVTLAKDGKSFTYGYDGATTTVEINEKAIYVDGRLSDEQIEGFDNVYNSFKQAMDHLVDGTEDEPMTMYLAPYVYWIHNPDSTNTEEAFGIVKSCENLHIVGLTENAKNVVIAANYGHNEGYDGGNWTMFSLSGDGLTLKNLTFGDYCNVDLEYPLNPVLNREKRTNNVTQGQIASYSGDKLYAENCRFVSRLNMMPFNNSKRALYVDCHMESTDDSLNGSSQAVYYGCDFEFYSSKPWGGSSGVTLLNCQMKLCHINVGDKVEQYLAKGAGPYAVIDCEFIHDYTVPTTFGWSDILSDTYRSYYSNVKVNGENITMDNGGKAPDAGVDLTGTEALKAYKLTDTNGDTIYNIYNLLRGTDDWDPLGQKEKVTALSATDVPLKATAYTDKTTSMWGTTYTSSKTIESGKDTVEINVDVFGRQSTDYMADLSVEYSVKEEDKDLVKLTPSADGKSCTVEGTNNLEEAKLVIVTAKLSNGLEGVVALTVRPTVLPAPTFTAEPTVEQKSDGTAQVNYALDLGTRADMSRIIWSVCDDAQGTNPIEIAVGRSTTPLKTITLSKAYVGKYLKVSVESKNIRSDYGEAHEVIATAPITAEGITESNVINPDLSTMSVKAQTQLIKGFWTLDAYIPEDTQAGYIPLDGTEVYTKWSAKVSNWTTVNEQSWAYGTGAKNGFLDYTGIYHTGRGARMRYSTLRETTGDMDLTLKLAPGKTAAQGFGSDYQYFDFMIKFDNETLTGYGLRIYRRSGNSCEFVLMEYKDGKNKEISDPIEASCYLTECTVHVWTEEGGTKLKASVVTDNSQAQSIADTVNATPGKDVKTSVALEATIQSNAYGDVCLINTGTTGDNTTYIGDIKIEYKD